MVRATCIVRSAQAASECLELALLGQPVLRKIATPVERINCDSVTRICRQLETGVHKWGGVGLAAPQIFHSRRLFIMPEATRDTCEMTGNMEIAINPEILAHSDRVIDGFEGCLSIPGLRALVPRYDNIHVKYFNPNGKEIERELAGFVARVFQHEFDHLNGVVYLDRVTKIESYMMESELEKLSIIDMRELGDESL